MSNRPIASATLATDQPTTDSALIGKRESPKLSAEAAERLLGLLSSDDAFRAQFEQDARASLASIGLPLEAATCLHFKRLASKDVIRGSFDALRLVLTGSLAFNVHDLDASPLH